MDAATGPENHDWDQDNNPRKLMVRGFVCPRSTCGQSIMIRRGMLICSKEGLEVGQVAAVVLDPIHRKATHILLGRLPETRGYWLVPVDLIAGVSDENVRLSVSIQAVETLPRWLSV